MTYFKDKTSALRHNFMGVACFLFFYSLIGCMIIFNITRGSYHGQEIVQRQLTFTMMCLCFAFAIFRLSDKTLKKLLLPACITVYLSLWGLFIFGTRINGACSWYRFGDYSLQPAELAKPCFIVALAVFCQKIKGCNKPWTRFLCLLGFITFILLPMALQPDFGTILVYAITFVFVIWADGTPNKHLLSFAVLALLGIAAVLAKYRHVRMRLFSFFTGLFIPDTQFNYHSQRLMECIVKGGWTGALGHPNDALHSLPMRHNDSFFAGATELLGAAGVIPIVLICTAWHYYCSCLALREQDPTRRLIFQGAGIILVSQALIHLAVNLGLMPNTGINLPMFSYGGSSLLATFTIITIVQRLRCMENSLDSESVSLAA